MYAAVTDSYESIARIRLMRTENNSVRVAVNSKVCRSAVALFITCSQGLSA
jgi:hypothetical protein